MAEYRDALKSLHTTLVDSKKGYEEALADAEGKGLTPLFRDMIALREKNHAELDTLLRAAGETPDESGSFLSLVHKTIFKVRSVFNGLDESVLPGLIDGETRIADAYEDVLGNTPPAEASAALDRQLNALRGKISEMQALRDRAEAKA